MRSICCCNWNNKMKLCMCGCGKPAPIAVKTSSQFGRIKGQPSKFIHGHNSRGNQYRVSHGHASGTKSPEYRAFSAAKARCTNPKHEQWKDYGGRGIKFKFSSFKKFLSNVGLKPKPYGAFCLDRENNNGNYEPGNVRWVTNSSSNFNRRKPTT